MTLRVGLVPQDERGPEKGKKASAAICDHSSCHHTSELVGRTFTVTRLGASSLRAPPSASGRASPIPQTDKWHWHLEGGAHSKWIIEGRCMP